MNEPTPLVVHTPRRSRVGTIFALVLVLLSIGFLWLAYRAWQVHLQLTSLSSTEQ